MTAMVRRQLGPRVFKFIEYKPVVAISLCLLLIQFMDAFMWVFSWKFSTFFNIVSIKTLFQNRISVKKIAQINSLWRHHSICCLFSLWMNFLRVFYQIFRPSTSCPSIFLLKIVQRNSLGGAIIRFAAYSAYRRTYVRFPRNFRHSSTLSDRKFFA